MKLTLRDQRSVPEYTPKSISYFEGGAALLAAYALSIFLVISLLRYASPFLIAPAWVVLLLLCLVIGLTVWAAFKMMIAIEDFGGRRLLSCERYFRRVSEQWRRNRT
jgi:hypothetical protein